MNACKLHYYIKQYYYNNYNNKNTIVIYIVCDPKLYLYNNKDDMIIISYLDNTIDNNCGFMQKIHARTHARTHTHA